MSSLLSKHKIEKKFLTLPVRIVQNEERYFVVISFMQYTYITPNKMRLLKAFLDQFYLRETQKYVLVKSEMLKYYTVAFKTLCEKCQISNYFYGLCTSYLNTVY